MGDFLKLVFEQLREYFIPFVVINSDEQGIRWTLGRPRLLLHGQGLFKTGLFVYCPLLQRVEKEIVTYQEIDCLLQTLDTSDRQPISLSCNVGYIIRNYMKWRTSVQDFDNSLERATRVHLFQVITNATLLETRQSLRLLEDQARKALQRQATDWGVRIVRVGLTDMTNALPLRLL